MKVLLVDDYQSNTLVLEKFLRLKGYDVTACNDGRMGLELISKNQWDKILLDLSMPEFSGYDIISSLEEKNILKEKNIILFSASVISEKLLSVLLQKEGIKDFIKKPCSLKKILQVISA